MTKIRLVTDSTSDIPAGLREALGIETVPLKVHFGSETFLDAVTIQADEFYERLSKAQTMPTTSQPSPVDFVNVYKRLLQEDPEAQIISIHLSAAFSGTYQSAVLAKSLLEKGAANITTIDSKSATYGIGMLAVAAAEAAREGKTMEEIIELIERLRREMSVFFLVDRLEYLHKGGRIGKAAAVFGSLLNIKPILFIDEDGEVASVDKIRGQNRAMARIVELIKERYGDAPLQVTVAHAHATEHAAQLSALIERHVQVKSLSYTSIGPVIGTHVGGGTVGAIIVPV